jgi:hypothetical protein
MKNAMNDPKPSVSRTLSFADEDEVITLRLPTRVTEAVQSSSFETTSKASTTKEKFSSEAQQENEKEKSLTDTLQEKREAN